MSHINDMRVMSQLLLISMFGNDAIILYLLGW